MRAKDHLRSCRASRRRSVAPRWLAAATDVLATPDDLELFGQHEPVLETVTLELWRHGARLFETDV